VEIKLGLSCTFTCHQIPIVNFTHTLLHWLSQTLMLKKLRWVCWTFKSDLRSTTRCDQIIDLAFVNLVTPKGVAKHELLYIGYQDTAEIKLKSYKWSFCSRLVEQNVKLSLSFGCDKIHKHCSKVGHTFQCCLSPTNRCGFVEQPGLT